MSSPWTESVPTISLKYLVDVQLGKMLQTTAATEADKPVPYLKLGTMESPDISVDQEMFASPADVGRYQVIEGDLIVAEGGDVGRTAFVPRVPDRTIIQNSLHRLRSKRRSNIRFVRYSLEAIRSSGWLSELCSKATFGHLTREKLTSLAIPLRPTDEQGVIADYLDAETARIDALIEKKLSLIARLGERADATLLHLTLNEWSQGVRIPVKRVATRVLSEAVDGDEILTAYRDGQVTARSVRRAEGYTMADDESKFLHVDKGDLVFHGLDGFAGAVGVAEMGGKCSPVYHVCKVKSPNLAAFVALQLRALAMAGYVELQSSSVRQRAVDLRNWDRFGSLVIALPPPAAQSQVVETILSVRSRCRRLSDLLEDQVQLLVEHRQALITAAVTGDLPIPGVAA